ncbi:MurR/RpiR family transcriptional regulator [Dactylosporangium sp. AC04546]|uniref:MurR/RpiR family transcriptional regulator n=1 Tax=Dactylosporangium sp. AC04546 TaxID=2862460 RepID=UPI001EDF5D76|nr:MurR/RpiR family transcriptional regulator [Dactylosporangium sp. AC04546]WVK78762.1 MurR/RpiR family transcriptional regulator [Dactylosporangium sp. AC04546]
MVDDLMSDMRRRYEDLTQSQKRIAEAIVEDPEFVAFATVDKLAGRLGVSPSTVVRFAYRLGLNGYQDLQERVRVQVRSQIRGSAGKGEPLAALAHLDGSVHAQSLARDIENLDRTVAELSVEVIDSAVEAIHDARRVYVVGGMASDGLATFAALTLGRLHGDAVMIRNDGHAGPALYEASREDTFLALSFPPYASHTVAVVDQARKRRSRIIAITDSLISPIAQRAEIVLPVHVAGVASQNSLVAPLAVINVLLNGVSARSPHARSRARAIMDLMDGWDSFVLKGEQ